MNDVLQNKKKAIDIEILDYKQCFDSMWMKECLNDLWEAGILDDHLAQNNEINKKKTPRLNFPCLYLFPKPLYGKVY